VQFIRNPEGLKDALVKIAVAPDGAHLTAADAEQAAHMFFAEGLNRALATHPPLLERIRELDPQFDESEIARVAAELARPGGPGLDVGAAGDATSREAPRAVQGSLQPAFNRIASVAALAGSMDAAHIEQAQVIRAALPDVVREFQSPGRAQALVLALLLSKDSEVRQRQLELLGRTLSVGNFAVIQQIAPQVDAIDPMLRLPALQAVFPALRRAPVAQRKTLAQVASTLIHADARIDVFEFSLAKLLETLLRDEVGARVPHGTRSLEDVKNDINALFATLAQLGSKDEHSARVAYEAGITVVLPMQRPEYRPLADWPRQLSEALQRLEQLNPLAKKAVIDGLVKTIASDEVMTEAESELLRTVCAVLHCPLPIAAGLPGPRTG